MAVGQPLNLVVLTLDLDVSVSGSSSNVGSDAGRSLMGVDCKYKGT